MKLLIEKMELEFDSVDGLVEGFLQQLSEQQDKPAAKSSKAAKKPAAKKETKKPAKKKEEEAAEADGPDDKDFRALVTAESKRTGDSKACMDVIRDAGFQKMADVPVGERMELLDLIKQLPDADKAEDELE